VCGFNQCHGLEFLNELLRHHTRCRSGFPTDDFDRPNLTLTTAGVKKFVGPKFCLQHAK
jgi:hypothetical protein